MELVLQSGRCQPGPHAAPGRSTVGLLRLSLSGWLEKLPGLPVPGFLPQICESLRIRDKHGGGEALKCETLSKPRVTFFHITEIFFQSRIPLGYFGCPERDNSWSLVLTVVSPFKSLTPMSSFPGLLVGYTAFSADISSTSSQAVQTFFPDLLCSMYCLLDTVLYIFCNTFKAFEIFQSLAIFPTAIDQSLCDAVPGCARIFRALHMVTDLQWSIMVASLLAMTLTSSAL